ncbi:hypothetical protein DSO57_1012741 [Entomophthora muscae]|uniref:Uncharacterized protein n=1 Tax=Entomophthora muscae TaxID=34485 RepID=A0ACC2U3N8_9FUNG|nr:hypothetical protein DSO57_1012741 [Entomophthora muscae]
MFSHLSILLAMYGLVTRLVFMSKKTLPHPPCHEEFTIPSSPSSKGCFRLNPRISLSTNQVWVRSPSIFRQFHHQLPNATNLRVNCCNYIRPGLYLRSIETSYVLADAESLGSLECKQDHLCLVEIPQHRLAIKHFNNSNIDELKQQMLQLVKSSAYHLVLHGPISGNVTFTPIQCEHKCSYSQIRLASKQVRKLHDIYLAKNIRDGILTFNPTFSNASATKLMFNPFK